MAGEDGGEVMVVMAVMASITPSVVWAFWILKELPV
jgi:hypothetical protein